MQEDSDLRLKRSIVTSVLVSLLILSTVGSVFVASSHPGFKSIKVNPIRENALAQYQTSEPIFIQSNADFVSQGATGNGTLSNPYTFENLQISNTTSCIQITDTTAYFVISNCKLESDDSDPVIWFDSVENGRVEQCEIAGGYNGLELASSYNCSITENSIYNASNGVVLLSASNCSVIDNSVHNNHRGVQLDYSDHCHVLNNSIYSNWGYGIEVELLSHNNTIYGNYIGWNDIAVGAGGNALDNGGDNAFDDGSSIGNFWSNFITSEIYQIPGSAGSNDTFAQLLEDTINPIIVPLDDTAIDVEVPGNTLTWLVYDTFPESYYIQENEVETYSAIWNGEDITIGLDQLPVGVHSITITLYDGAGNIGSDEVLVTVVSFILGGIGTELVMMASGITVACFVVIILLIKRLS